MARTSFPKLPDMQTVYYNTLTSRHWQLWPPLQRRFYYPTSTRPSRRVKGLRVSRMLLTAPVFILGDLIQTTVRPRLSRVTKPTITHSLTYDHLFSDHRSSVSLLSQGIDYILSRDKALYHSPQTLSRWTLPLVEPIDLPTCMITSVPETNFGSTAYLFHLRGIAAD